MTSKSGNVHIGRSILSEVTGLGWSEALAVTLTLAFAGANAAVSRVLANPSGWNSPLLGSCLANINNAHAAMVPFFLTSDPITAGIPFGMVAASQLFALLTAKGGVIGGLARSFTPVLPDLNAAAAAGQTAHSSLAGKTAHKVADTVLHAKKAAQMAAGAEGIGGSTAGWGVVGSPGSIFEQFLYSLALALLAAGTTKQPAPAFLALVSLGLGGSCSALQIHAYDASWSWAHLLAIKAAVMMVSTFVPCVVVLVIQRRHLSFVRQAFTRPEKAPEGGLKVTAPPPTAAAAPSTVVSTTPLSVLRRLNKNDLLAAVAVSAAATIAELVSGSEFLRRSVVPGSAPGIRNVVVPIVAWMAYRRLLDPTYRSAAAQHVTPPSSAASSSTAAPIGAAKTGLGSSAGEVSQERQQYRADLAESVEGLLAAAHAAGIETDADAIRAKTGSYVSETYRIRQEARERAAERSGKSTSGSLHSSADDIPVQRAS